MAQIPFGIFQIGENWFGVRQRCRLLCRILALALGSCVLLACEPAPETIERTIEEIKASGELVVLTRNAPTVRYVDRDEVVTGPEHDLVMAFANLLGVAVRYSEREDITQIISALSEGKADLAAAGLTVTDERKKLFGFSSPYQSVDQSVVCRRGGPRLKTAADLVGVDLRIVANSSYEELLQQLKLEKVPQLVWKSVKGASTEALLYGVWQKEFDCTVADSNILALNRRFMPELTSPLVVGQTQHLAWMLPQGALKLQSAVNEWLDAFRSSGALAQWHDHYYGFIEEYDYVDNKKLHDRVPSRYKPHAHLFETAAEKYDLSLTLLAAQSYQESHWRPKAKSPTGVRGMMMLTRVTAKSMGVTDRLDAAQSIDGGARYLKAMKARFSENVVEPDRTWMALAAYNIGRAHLHDAQRLARERGLSPYKWSDIQTILPLLSQPDVYKKLKYGYARGHEPVQYVRRIREYEHVLKRLLSQDT